MGLYDRDYVREDPRGIHLGGEWSGVVLLIVVNVAVYVVDLLSNFKLQDYARLQANLFFAPWNAWQLITAGFLHSGDNLGHLFWNMFALWLFGNDLEGIIGKRRFILFYLSTLILSGLAWVAVETLTAINTPGAIDQLHKHTVIGASGAISGVIAASILFLPNRILYFFGVFPLPVWLLGIFYLIGDLSGALGYRDSDVAYVAHLGGAACGALFWKTGFSLGELWPSGWQLGNFRSWSKKLRPKNVRIYRPQDASDDLEPTLDQTDDAVERILQKITDQGIGSLTAAEKQILEQASRKLQKRRR
ncbi:MAG: rhomboid family intramembrane serine protease [Pirellulales bacterium]|nr:rhomboid family intramembrane serine protease [Pirellulales bacterium]